MFYSHFTPGLLSLCSGFTHSLHHTFVHVYTPFSPGFITLKSMSSHAKPKVSPHFTPGLHALYHIYSSSTPGVLIPFSGFYSHFSLSLLSPCFGFMHTLPGFTHTLLRVYSQLTLGFTHTFLWVYTHFTLGLVTHYARCTHTLLWIYSHLSGFTHTFLQYLLTLYFRFTWTC